MRWEEMTNATRGRKPTRVSTNGQIVLAAQARRAAGIEPGDLVVSVPVGPGAVLVEKVGAEGAAVEPPDVLAGLWGPDPDAWLDELRGSWDERERS
jgi:bifunctional DNA-binding transcriptional regulator/antitoxin component of YhaV-PrlF toxin-antitoxin module